MDWTLIPWRKLNKTEELLSHACPEKKRSPSKKEKEKKRSWKRERERERG
jgi:fatty acid desaturase